MTSDHTPSQRRVGLRLSLACLASFAAFSMALAESVVFVSQGNSPSNSSATTPENDALAANTWAIIKDSGDAGLIRSFRKQFPDSDYDAVATLLLYDLLASDQPAAQGAAAPVYFSTPLSGFGVELDGKSLEKLIKSNPRFSPIEGLPDQVWKEKNCADCHAWTQEDLCTQSNHYLIPENTHRLNVEHPLGKPFKQVLKSWAEGGCG